MSDKSMLTGEWEVSKSLMLTLVVFGVIVVGGIFIYKWQMNKKAKKEDPESKPAGSSTTTASGVTTEVKTN